MKTGLLTAALSAIALAAAAGPLPAASGKARVVVSTRGVDFNDPAQVRSLHRRLVRAAATVCDEHVPPTVGLPRYDRACAEAALDRVVAAAGSPELTAFHQTRAVAAPLMKRAAR